MKKSRLQLEFDILEKNVEDAVVVPFKDEIIALVEKFGESGQSGGSAPYTAQAIASAIQELCLHRPLFGIMNDDSEWYEPTEGMIQNIRLSSVFKNVNDGRPYYLDAIIFTNQHGSSFTSNSVKLNDGSLLGSRQYIKEFPFKPKSFYIDVIDTEWHKDKETGELTMQEGGGWWTSELKDDSQLKEVFEFYDRFEYDK